MGRLMSATTPRASRGPVHREVESSLASWEVLPVTISSGNSEARAGAIELKQHVVESFQNEKVIAEGEEGDDAATMVGTLSGSETSKSVGEHMDFVLAKDAEVADQLQSLQIASPQPLIAQFSTNVQLLRNPLLESTNHSISRGYTARPANQRRPPRSNTLPTGSTERPKFEKKVTKRRATENSGNGPDSGRKRDKTSSALEDEERFACPYFKSDRVKHINCLHFQLKRVKDVKQHIFRKHDFHCDTCYEVFPDCQRCEDHTGQRTCRIVPVPPSHVVLESISETQKHQLTSRTSTGRPESEQWFGMWDILFPTKERPSSPYLKSQIEETIMTAQEAFTKHRSQVFGSLNSIVRLNTGSPDNLVGSNSAAQSVLAHNTPELADNLVQSVFDELVRVSAPTRGPRFDPLLSSSEPWTLQPWSSPEDRLEPQHADQDPASFLLSYDQMNSDPSNDLIDNGGIAAQSSVPAMWPGTQDGVCAGGLEHIQSDSYNIEDNTDIESSLLLGYNVIGPGSADFLKWEGNEDFQLWN
ncbi:hypothetical protein CGCF415_v010207 [Colletotrichum fructicola]|nr:hypothetical protein CGCFRS4_v015023 [Colletotrichum fructicola]KAF4900190.1 hypothetical protein CGCF415_v010207 [Colletotrichum fructicola]KAF4933022.1 hypothetical protein CGCF245_v010075 [Colletotrichum fructicola]